jgi:hypothetical protein
VGEIPAGRVAVVCSHKQWGPVYATCIFCNSALGQNDSIEHFPVGRKLAFDAAKGRLWAVCGTCERWNLSPLEERWEAIEESERAFRDATKRVATDNIGLAKLQDGTELVRIGAPLKKEFAFWRYDDIVRKRNWQLFYQMTGIGVLSPFLTHMAPVAVGASMFGGAAVQLGVSAIYQTVQSHRHSVRITDNNGILLTLTRYQATWARYHFDEREARLSLNVASWSDADQSILSRAGSRLLSAATLSKRNYRRVDIEGEAAIKALHNMLPAVNVYFNDATVVNSAVDLIERAGHPIAMLQIARHTTPPEKSRRFDPKRGRLMSVPPVVRLAVEMSTHEEEERRLLEGDARELERRWKDAEEIAAISDSLTLPMCVEHDMQQLRERHASASIG